MDLYRGAYQQRPGWGAVRCRRRTPRVPLGAELATRHRPPRTGRSFASSF